MKVPAAHHGPNGAGRRLQHDHSPFHQRLLFQHPIGFGRFLRILDLAEPGDIADVQEVCRGALRGPRDAWHLDLDHAFGSAHLRRLSAGIQHQTGDPRVRSGITPDESLDRIGLQVGSLAAEDGSAVAAPMIEAQQAGAQGRLGRGLDLQVERRSHLEPLVIQPIVAVGLLEVLAHLFGEKWTDLFLARRMDDDERAGDRLIMFGGGDESLVEHPVQDVVAPFHDLIGMPVGAEPAGALDDSSKSRGLGEGQLRNSVSEVGSSRALHAVVAVAEKHHVQIHCQDLLLAQLFFELDGEEGLRDLAAPVLLVGQE